METTPNIPRLRHLITVLDRVPPDKFHLDSWATNECGTTCCAVGWAALDRDFQSDGLHLIAQKLFSGEDYTIRGLADLPKWRPANRVAIPEFGNLTNWKAVNAFFGLSPKQSNCLFDPREYPLGERSSVPAVQARIHAIIARAMASAAPHHEPEVAEAMNT